jgi:hypothetical protein
MNKFGWSYPPGAANDPNAPYNQDSADIVMLKEKVVVARKEHVCDMCQAKIKIGDKYRYFVFIDYDDGGKLSTSHQHVICPCEADWIWER